jgi:hypothetical protein
MYQYGAKLTAIGHALTIDPRNSEDFKEDGEEKGAPCRISVEEGESVHAAL